MISSALPHYSKTLRGLTLILLLGLLAFGIYDGSGKEKLADDAHQSNLLSLSSSTNEVISDYTSSTDETSSQIGLENSFNGFSEVLLASIASNSVNEDERLYPQILPYYSSVQRINNLTHQKLAPSFFRHDFSNLSLKILSTIVFLH